ncbi:NUDIX hydrolase [Ferribacterium limneticum]|uniref:NUDIX hydrolase n=1 Tax=Ferribacterium limneticum TaxID=76259 RepID=UPI001CF896C0|nr:NUDIX hydrolase [Ferribacterium limneticum]
MTSDRPERTVRVEKETLYLFPDSACAVHTFIARPNTLILVKQWRPFHGVYTLELPGGRVELGESPEEAAVRELWEETGIAGKAMEKLFKLDMDFSVSNHCTQLVRTNSPEPLTLRDEVILLELEEAFDALKSQKITHAPTVTAILLLIAERSING